MNVDFHAPIPADFAPGSRVWIYQSNRAFSTSESAQIAAMLNTFAATWLSHGAKVKGAGTLLFNQFIVLLADESATGVSGCSTDSMVRLIKEMEQVFQVSLFDRQSLAFFKQDAVVIVRLKNLKESFENKSIHPDTLYFNNTVLTKRDLLLNWIVPVKSSWLAAKYLSTIPA